MKSFVFRAVTAALMCCGILGVAGAQDAAPKPPYLDTSLSAEQRAADLVKHMTLQEKITQLVNQARAIPRLNVPAYDWWSESLHGVAVNGTTEFPEPIGLAATFDTPAIHEMAIAIGTEGRIKHAQDVRAVHSGPEPTRHTADVTVSKHDELDTYLPAFRATVTEAKADSVMCAYNSINGQPACANEFLLQDQLRNKWGFKGYVVSDCGAVIDIFTGHHFKGTQ